MNHQWDAKFSGRFVNAISRRVDNDFTKHRITVFENDREDAIKEVVRQAKLYGYCDVTVDHITKVW